MSRPKKEIPKRISGTGYTKAESHQLLYCKQSEDGSYEIDTQAIEKVIEAYIKARSDEEGNIIKPMSEASLMATLGIRQRETLKLWEKGYTNRDHAKMEEYTYNSALANAVSRGLNAVAIYLSESEGGKYKAHMMELQLAALGYLDNTQKIDVTVNVIGRQWRKYAK